MERVKSSAKRVFLQKYVAAEKMGGSLQLERQQKAQRAFFWALPAPNMDNHVKGSTASSIVLWARQAFQVLMTSEGLGSFSASLEPGL